MWPRFTWQWWGYAIGAVLTGVGSIGALITIGTGSALSPWLIVMMIGLVPLITLNPTWRGRWGKRD